MIYITGDCHARFHKFSTDAFPEQKEMTRDDYVIVCGDFGGVFFDDKTERWWLKWLSEKPFTILYVDGNHENFDRLYGDEFEVVDFHGGKAHKIRANIYHLMRGYVFNLEGKKFFAFGGASSHDIDDGVLDEKDFGSYKELIAKASAMRKANKSFRINHLSWWEQELPSKEEMAFGLQTLSENDNKVDFVITHCCPQEIAAISGFYNPDILTKYFDTVAKTIQFKKWFFGHYHDDRQIMSDFIMLYDQIVRIV